MNALGRKSCLKQVQIRYFNDMDYQIFSMIYCLFYIGFKTLKGRISYRSQRELYKEDSGYVVDQIELSEITEMQNV